MKMKFVNIAAGIGMFAISVLLVLGSIYLCFPTAFADGPEDVNYMQIMIDSVVNRDYETGRWAESMRNDKIINNNLNYILVDYDELDLLSRLIQEEAGSDGISQEWRMDVGEVVMHRIASSEFPNTLHDVIFQRGQYYPVISGSIYSSVPRRECVEAALAVLEGRDDMPDTVVFQANFSQGSVYRTYYLYPYGTTYFGESYNKYLYN